MFTRTTLFCITYVIAVNSYPQSPFFSYSSGGPSSSSPPQFGGGFPPSPFGKGSGLSSSPFSSGGPPSSSPFSSGGPPSSSPFSSGGPPSSLFGSGGPPSSSPYSNGPPGRPGGRPKSPPGNKLFSWIGSQMSKLQGLGPKLHYYPPKSKPSSLGSSSLSPSAHNAPPKYFSSGGPPRESLNFPPIPNSIFEGSSSPFEGGSTVTYSSPSHSSSIDHPQVNYRNPSGPPRGPPPRFALSRPPSFGSRPPPSYSNGPPQYSSSRPPFGGSPYPRPPPQDTRNNLEVFPSQQVSYQSETLQNEPGFDGSFGSLQNLYKSQSSQRPSSYYQSQQQQGPSNYEQQSSYSQNKPQVSQNSGANYGATFHSIEPVRVAPIYDVGDSFKPSSTDLSGSTSQVQNNQQQQQQTSNIHDASFATLVNDYAAQADAATSSSEQMITALQGSQDMVTSASTNINIPGMQILGQSSSPDGNPIFEVVADANAPTYDGHPVDLNKLISMIEPGAQIDTMPAYNSDADLGASDHHPVYAHAPSNLELESDAAMASGIMSGNKADASEKSQIRFNSQKIRFNNINDQLQAVASSESRPTVVKPDGTRLDDEKLIKEHFDKEIILDDLQENKDRGFIIVGINTDDNDTGDQNEDEHLHGTQKNWTLNDSFDSNNNNTNYKDDMLAIVQQLRNSAFSAVVEKTKNGGGGRYTPNSNNMTDSSYLEENTKTKTTQHPNHNYYPELSPSLLEMKEHKESDTREKLPVINPIFDSVRQSRLSEVDSENDTTSLLDFHSDKVVDNSKQSNEDDDDINYPDADDLVLGADGDLAASGSRNVKSVAIIVTPPPNYVKIRNKYKKPITPLSAATSSTTPLSAIPSNSSSSESLKSNNFSISAAANNSRDNQNINDKESSISSTTTAASVITSSSLPTNQPNSGSSNNDSILNTSTINGGIDIGQLINNNSDMSSSSRPPTENKQPRRYPVYRGRDNNAS